MLRAGGAEAGKIGEVWGAGLAITIWLMEVNTQNLVVLGAMHDHIPRELVNGPRVDRGSHQSQLQEHTQFLALAIRYDYSQYIFLGPATSYSSTNPSDEITIELTNA